MASEWRIRGGEEEKGNFIGDVKLIGFRKDFKRVRKREQYKFIYIQNKDLYIYIYISIHNIKIKKNI